MRNLGEEVLGMYVAWHLVSLGYGWQRAIVEGIDMWWAYSRFNRSVRWYGPR